MCIHTYIYTYIIYTPNSGLPIAVFVFERKHGRFNHEDEGAAREHGGAWLPTTRDAAQDARIGRLMRRYSGQEYNHVILCRDAPYRAELAV